MYIIFPCNNTLTREKGTGFVITWMVTLCLSYIIQVYMQEMGNYFHGFSYYITNYNL